MAYTLQVRNFPTWLRKWLKLKATEREVTMEQIVIEIISKAHNQNGGGK